MSGAVDLELADSTVDAALGALDSLYDDQPREAFRLAKITFVSLGVRLSCADHAAWLVGLRIVWRDGDLDLVPIDPPPAGSGGPLRPSDTR